MPQYVTDWIVLIVGYGVLYFWTEHDRKKTTRKDHHDGNSNEG